MFRASTAAKPVRSRRASLVESSEQIKIEAAIEATDAYQEAVAMLTHAQVSMADSMVHVEIISLQQLLSQIAQQVDRAA